MYSEYITASNGMCIVLARSYSSIQQTHIQLKAYSVAKFGSEVRDFGSGPESLLWLRSLMI